MPHDNDLHKYDAIINLPHPTSKKHPRMSMLNRAAQFSPFAAQTGYDAAVKETARLTDQRVELDEYQKAALDERLQIIQEHLQERPEVSLTYFKPDERKAGGAYLTITNIVKKIDTYERLVVMMDGSKIPIDEIMELNSELFKSLDDSIV